MGEKLVIGPITKGYTTNVRPFNIDNDAFPLLVNAYQWRGRIKRKRGTSQLGRLTRNLASVSAGNVTLSNPSPNTFALFTGLGLNVAQPDASIVPGNLTNISIVIGAQTLTDTVGTGTLTVTAGNITAATINYATGVLTLSFAAPAGPLAVTFTGAYYPTLPVMGIEDLTITGTQYPQNLAFDTTYSYRIVNNSPYPIYSTSFYKNPAVSGSLPGYVAKVAWTAVTWNGQNYQQFGSTNYAGAFWTTNGIISPTNLSSVGMQFKAITGVAIVAGGPPAIVTLTIVGHGLVVGDFLFLNEIGGNTGINFQTCYVTVVVNANQVTVEFPIGTIAGAYTAGGIAQYLTNRSDTTKDCIRWFDGDPTSGSAPYAASTALGWVNFMPPLMQNAFSLASLPAAQYYLVGCIAIKAFKDRLLFFGPVVQTSTGSPIYLQDTVIYSEVGTPYYTASFAGSPTFATTYQPVLTPANQTATAMAWFEDITGVGGSVVSGLNGAITTVSSNEDVLVLGFNNNIQTRFVYTGNDIVPFNFFVINSELGSGSTFSAVNLDRGVITIGDNGIIITSQTSATRIDLQIPYQIFQINLSNNGAQRVTAARDFVNEWIYFSYPDNSTSFNFPNNTLQFNYRDNTWALFYETYTTYGTFRRATGYTWATIGTVYPTWSDWTVPWDSMGTTILQPEVIAGNQQGFVVFRSNGTGEAPSLAIAGFSGSTVTSNNHGLNTGDYIVISGALGTVGTQVNGKVFQVTVLTSSTFTIVPSLTAGYTYLGSGVITRIYNPLIQTKQFPMAWGMSRKTRLGAQQYLLTRTDNGQITVYIFLSQDGSSPWNYGSIVPTTTPPPVNNSLIYSAIVYTCPESTNLGLTPANTNLQMPTAASQSEIWHRMNTSLLGDTVQLGFTMTADQLSDSTLENQFAEIEIHSIILDISPSSLLA